MSDDPPTLDEQVLAELRASVGDDDEFVADLARTFIEEGGGHIEAMDAACAAGDATAIVRPAHSLKSSSAALGAMRLSSISREIEFAGREGRTDGLNEQMAEAHAAWDDTVAELKARGLAG
ncbi:MAG TPA: Hpt domain-containing protein [Candidatus Limnocylindrales bacterium]|nr:Hpt domain-containing protein [Candidatus Limnocylindrales bacterium]